MRAVRLLSPQVVVLVGVLILLGLMASVGGLAAGVLVIVLFGVTGGPATAVVVVAMTASAAVGTLAALRFESSVVRLREQVGALR